MGTCAKWTSAPVRPIIVQTSMSRRGPANPERAFGLSVGSVLCVLAGVLAWRGRTAAAEVTLVAGIVLVTCGWLRQALLAWPSALWWRFAGVLAYVNARVLLTLLYSIALVPLGAVWRLSGNDPLARGRATYQGWSSYPARYRDRKHYSRMF